eukprot:scaffold162186_cov63-Attheya_sp.AAC.1
MTSYWIFLLSLDCLITCLFLEHNKSKRSEELEGFDFSSKVDKQTTGRVTPEMLGVLLVTQETFDMASTKGNTVKYMTTSAQTQNLAYFIRSCVCAIILEKEEELKSNRLFLKVVAALSQWTFDGSDAANEKDSHVRANLNTVTLYDKRGILVQLTHCCLKTLTKCSIDIQRRLADKARRLQNGEEVQKIPTVHKLDNFDDAMTGDSLMNDNSVVGTVGCSSKKRGV